MKIYNYDNDGYYINESLADEDPLTAGEYLIPGNATSEPPPPTSAHEICKFDGGWKIVMDLRGTQYWLDDALHTITEIGVELPAGSSLEKPQSVIDAEFVQYKQTARDAINRIRDSRIYAGVEFPPDSGVMFDSDELAQKNINGAVTMSILAAASGQQFEQPWIAKDNSVVTLDAAGVTGLGVTLGRHAGKHRLEANAAKSALDAATDAVSVQAVIDAYMAAGQ